MTEEEKKKAEFLGLIPRQEVKRREEVGGTNAKDADLSEQEGKLNTNGISQDDSEESLQELEDKLQELVAKKKSTVEFCHNAGLTYVSCSPYRFQIARLVEQVAIKQLR